MLILGFLSWSSRFGEGEGREEAEDQKGGGGEEGEQERKKIKGGGGGEEKKTEDGGKQGEMRNPNSAETFFLNPRKSRKQRGDRRRAVELRSSLIIINYFYFYFY